MYTVKLKECILVKLKETTLCTESDLALQNLFNA